MSKTLLEYRIPKRYGSQVLSGDLELQVFLSHSTPTQEENTHSLESRGIYIRGTQRSPVGGYKGQTAPCRHCSALSILAVDPTTSIITDGRQSTFFLFSDPSNRKGKYHNVGRVSSKERKQGEREF